MSSDEPVEYIHLPAGAVLPETCSKLRRVVILIEEKVDPAWQDAVSRWIVGSGCLYMMAWGRDCSSWDDSVDHANLARFDYGDVPDDEFVMTTWHDKEPLHEVFFHARMCAFHPTIEMPLLTILDVREDARESAILALHQAVKSGLLDDTRDDPRYLPIWERMKILMKIQ